MKLSFEANLPYQQEAIQAITDLFEGQPLDMGFAQSTFTEGALGLNINGVGNHLALSEARILANLKTIQKRNDIPTSETLAGMNFSVEMETGTGKTYVYLRTIYELHKLYGFMKFVIVVPSIAIREGVLKNLEITGEHFHNLYDKTPVNFQVYDSGKVSALRGFATNNNIEILVMNIDSFAKDENVINKPNDRLNGQKPIEFIQSTHPIVIVDEPQNMETEKRISAIEKLSALCTLRYSATHKNPYNLTYSLNPVKAYDLGLVKQIEVDSIIEENAKNTAFLIAESFTAKKTSVSAKVTIDYNDKDGVKKKTITVKVRDDLYKLSNEREVYKNGYIVEGIDVANGVISFTGGEVLFTGDSRGALTEEVMKLQIRKTIEEHLNKEKLLNKKGIKVLSLFFIDRVANYRQYDISGNPIHGKFATWFEAIYREFMEKPAYKELDKFAMTDIHNGYFSQDNKGAFKDTSGETKADDGTYSLIMKDKEKLLSLDTPLRFIFSHSALREGWDNPNVFQICTLNETKSDMKKRQEIGRGLRLAVNQEGVRIYDQNINRLTVIANESYEDFAKSLQREIEEDCGVSFTGRTKNKNHRVQVKYRKGFTADPYFLALWEKIKDKTTYRIDYKTEDLINKAAMAVKKMPPVTKPSLRSTKTKLTMTAENGVRGDYLGDRVTSFGHYSWKIPDVVGYIQNKTELTRSTILDIINQSERAQEILLNPQLFMDQATLAIKDSLDTFLINGIKYQKIGHAEYEMKLFEAEELAVYLNNFSFEVQDSSKTIYEDFIPLDSNVENQFAKDCETSAQVKFYFKLPKWFTIPTPIGGYNPDWALVFEEDKRIYFVAETKNTGTQQVALNKLRPEEKLKIECGKAHFKEFDAMEFKVVSTVSQLIG